jgi:DNA-binding transcriptional regulator PaaX
MGVSERSVQRSLSRLRKKGLLQQVRETQPDGSVHYFHDLSGLRGELILLARRDLRYSETVQKKGMQQ